LFLTAVGTCAVILALVLDLPALPGADASSDEEVTVRRYYAGINEAVRTGNLSLLDSVLAEEREGEPTTGSSPCPIRCQVATLHRLAPQSRLAIDEVTVAGDRVAVRLHIDGDETPELMGLPLVGDLAPWPSHEVLHVAGGRVIEARPADGRLAQIEPLARAAVEGIPAAPYRLGLVRLALDSDALMPKLMTRGPVMLLVEQGVAAARFDRPAIVRSRSHPDGTAREQIVSWAATLSPGDQLVLSGDTNYELRGSGNETAVLLSAVVHPGDQGISNRWIRARSLDEIVFMPEAPTHVATSSAPASWPPGVRSELLVDGVIIGRLAPAARLEMARLTIQPDAALPIHETGGAEAIVVERGSSLVDLVHGDGAIRPAPDMSLAKAPPQGKSARITRGGIAVLQAGASTGIRNSGDDPLTLLILAIVPGSVS
jgi:predicted ester cyclase